MAVIDGTNAAETLTGTAGNDTIHGYGGNDTIVGGSGSDLIYGGDGDDFIQTTTGGRTPAGLGASDTVYGGAGNDRIEVSSEYAVVYGDEGNDLLDGRYYISNIGQDNHVTLDGGVGNDTIFTGFGTSEVHAGQGNDLIWISSGSDTIHVAAEEGAFTTIERIQGEAMDDFLQFDKSAQQGVHLVLSASDGQYPNNGYYPGDAGGPTKYNNIAGHFSYNGYTSSGGIFEGINNFVGTDGDDLFDGRAVELGFGFVSMDLGEGDDTAYGTDWWDTIWGGAGNDFIDGGGGVDELYGGDGDDTIYGGAGEDYIEGGDGNDYLDGGADDDTIYGGDGDDTLYGGDGNDLLYGDGGQNELFGGDGNDTLVSQGGGDVLTGGRGNDHFGINSVAGSTTSATITDFNDADGGFSDGDPNNNDVVDLSSYYNDANLAIINAAREAQGLEPYPTPLGWLRADQADGTLNDITQSAGFDRDFELHILNNGVPVPPSDLTPENTCVVCFAGETLIETATGHLRAQDLRVGDLVRTRDSGMQPIRWIGTRVFAAAHLNASPNLRPIRIKAGALGATPTADLLVSPQHRVLCRSNVAQRMFGATEVLVAAKHLQQLPGVEIATDLNQVTYVHFLFDTHEIVFSNGAETESLFTGPEALKTVGPKALEEIFGIFPQLLNATVPELAREAVSGRKAKKLVDRHLQNERAFAG